MKAKEIFNSVKGYSDWKHRARYLSHNNEAVMQKVEDMMVNKGIISKPKKLSDVERLEQALKNNGVFDQ
jgi:hypothetical protein